MSKKQTKESIEESIRKTVSAIDEVLAKSGYSLAKDDGDPSSDELEDQAAADMSDEEAGMAGDPEDGMGGEPVADMDSAEDPEGDMGEGQADDQDVAAMAAELSDEELHMMLEVLSEEMARRQGQGQEAEGEQAAPADSQLAMSMKSEFSELAKSQAAMAEGIKTLAKSVEQMGQQIKARPAARPTKAAATSRQQVQVMEKSTPAAPVTKLSKSETIAFLEGEIRNGNRRVNSGLIADVMYCQSDKELASMQESIRKTGVQLPM